MFIAKYRGYFILELGSGFIEAAMFKRELIRYRLDRTAASVDLWWRGDPQLRYNNANISITLNYNGEI